MSDSDDTTTVDNLNTDQGRNERERQDFKEEGE